MIPRTSQMRAEIQEIPAAVDRLLTHGYNNIAEAAKRSRMLDPAFVATTARGSSDHVCTYLKYACELLLGLPVASIGPSVASIYGAQLRFRKAVCLSVSQSGRSPDIVTLTNAATGDGALTVAITNDPASPLASASACVLNAEAGVEKSVAATKSFVNCAVAGLLFLAEWKQDHELINAVRTLPAKLEQAIKCDWSVLGSALENHPSVLTLGRGPSWAISNEAALKFKETCQLHAESYSAAEVLHGPISIVAQGFPVVCFSAADAAEKSVVELADRIAALDARVFITGGNTRHALSLECVRTGHPLTDPISLIVSFYSMVERLARQRGVNPDTPRHLQKVTQTR